MPYMDTTKLESLGFSKLGTNVLISDKASIYNPELISIGNNVRIDDFCILSGKISLGSNVHIAAYNLLSGSNYGITMGDFSGLAFGCRLFCISDDYSGNLLTNPTVPKDLRQTNGAEVHIGKHSILGTSSVVFPGVVIEEGCAIGAMSLVNKSTLPWGVYLGIPARRIKDRSKNLISLEGQI